MGFSGGAETRYKKYPCKAPCKRKSYETICENIVSWYQTPVSSLPWMAVFRRRRPKTLASFPVVLGDFGFGSKLPLVTRIARSGLGTRLRKPNLWLGQYSLTSVERPSYLRTDFVNVWRHACLQVHLHFDVWLSISDRFLVRGFVPLFRSFLDWFQSIQTRRCHCLHLKDVLMFQASSYKLYSAGKRTFQWMLLNNVLWMALGMCDVSRWQLYIITFLIEYMYSA